MSTSAGRRSGLRNWVLVVLLVLGLVLLVALLAPPGGDRSLDPDSAGPSGSRAVAEILRKNGIEVTKVTTSTDALRRTRFPATLVVVHSRLLGPAQLDRIAESTARLVLVEPDQVTLDALDVWADAAGTVPDEVMAPGCDDPTAAPAGEVLAGGHLYRVKPVARPVQRCYPGGDDRWGYVDAYMEHHLVTVLGQGQALTNGNLAEQGNAALALRVLGREKRVVWYVPDPFEAGVEQPKTLSELAPPWVRFLLLQLGLAAVLAMLWRGRRMGPLVTEPLPVVVRSAETLEGRASLYRQSHARDRAAATLRTAALRRLARRLDLGRDTAPETAAQLVATAAGRAPSEVVGLLLGPAPASDAALVTLARDLDRLEDDLRTKDRTT